MMKTRLLIFLMLNAFALSFVAGCGEEGPPPPPPRFDFPLEVVVTDTADNPIPRVPVTVDDQVVGYTDKDGKFSGNLHERAGTPIKLSVQEIEGYRFVSDSAAIQESLKTTTLAGQTSGVPLLLQVRAESIRKDYFVWLKISCDETIPGEKCQGFEVKREDEVVATTDRHGFAHFSFAEVPGTEVKFTIDTPEPAENAEEAVVFEPADPVYTAKLDLDPYVYMVEEKFTDPVAAQKAEEEAKARKKRVRRSRSRARSKPKSKPKPKKKKDDGVIDLW